jgi:hypothetical protein
MRKTGEAALHTLETRAASIARILSWMTCIKRCFFAAVVDVWAMVVLIKSGSQPHSSCAGSDVDGRWGLCLRWTTHEFE